MKIHPEYTGYYRKTRHYHFYNNTYEINLYVFFGKSYYLEKMYPRLNWESRGKCLDEEENGDVSIWLNSRDVGPETIAHECLHAVSLVAKYRGLKYDVDNDESFTYLLSWFIKCVYMVK